MEPKSLAWGTSISKSTFIAKTSAESSQTQTQHSVFSIPTVLLAIEEKFLSIAFIKQLTNFPEKMTYYLCMIFSLFSSEIYVLLLY